ncbi:MAG: AsnC family transcriptional regulator [Kibdelosporangium sp.]
MDSVTIDDVDRGLIHALQIDGRVPLRAIAHVIGVSENTIARRYQRLRSAGVLRVAGVLNGARLGYTAWNLRLKCAPEAAGAIAEALAERPDTSWVYLLSGGTEVSCNIQRRPGDDLPRPRRVTAMTAHTILQAPLMPTEWVGLHWLNGSQTTELRVPRGDDAVPAAADDRALLDALAHDGRMGYAELATITGWSDSTVKRRMDHLRRSGVLAYMLDISHAALGFQTEARVWMTIQPSALARVGEILAGHPEVSFVGVTTGSTNLTATLNCRDNADLYRYLTERVSGLDAIRSMDTAPILRTVKRAGFLLPV